MSNQKFSSIKYSFAKLNWLHIWSGFSNIELLKNTDLGVFFPLHGFIWRQAPLENTSDFMKHSSISLHTLLCPWTCIRVWHHLPLKMGRGRVSVSKRSTYGTFTVGINCSISWLPSVLIWFIFHMLASVICFCRSNQEGRFISLLLLLSPPCQFFDT